MPSRSRTHPANRRQPAVDAESQPSIGRSPSIPLALSVAALVISLLALAATLFGGAGRGGALAGDCQGRAWDSVPEERELPSGWSVATMSFFVGNMTVTLEGPAADQETGEGVIYATVTCFGSDSSQALARSRAADAGSGTPTSDLEGIGEEGYAIGDDGTGLSAMHFRRGDLAAYLVVAGSVALEELDATARAFDAAMIDARPAVIPTVPPRSTGAAGTLPPEPSDEPGASAEPPSSAEPSGEPASPELQALLPTEIDGTRFVVQTFRASDAFGTDAGSRAMTAGLRALGKTPADLELGEAFDEAESMDLYLFAFRLPGVPLEDLRSLVLNSWLVADAEGVVTEDVELSGKTLTRVDYGDDFTASYLYATDEAVVVIQTGSEELAEAAAAALP